MKWSPDNQYLASGGNDNRLLVWSLHHSLSNSAVSHFSTTSDQPTSGSSALESGHGGPMLCYLDHIAAVKAIAWSPHQHGLLASGGGTADRCIRFWNTLTGQALRGVDTGSQVTFLFIIPYISSKYKVIVDHKTGG
ncbi:unnamed protein product [Protopolystoma xenopodis]|uniref:Uncharacterized protein n=1 Tax=Protopolystoma xenopodis TaxID=117903 RepID=A0A448WXH3_9PLAT|nr:unnamed protein product [Protopolystoma xenopodis]